MQKHELSLGLGEKNEEKREKGEGKRGKGAGKGEEGMDRRKVTGIWCKMEQKMGRGKVGREKVGGKGKGVRGKKPHKKTNLKNSYKRFKKNSEGTLKLTFFGHQDAPLYY